MCKGSATEKSCTIYWGIDQIAIAKVTRLNFKFVDKVKVEFGGAVFRNSDKR